MNIQRLENIQHKDGLLINRGDNNNIILDLDLDDQDKKNYLGTILNILYTKYDEQKEAQSAAETAAQAAAAAQAASGTSCGSPLYFGIEELFINTQSQQIPDLFSLIFFLVKLLKILQKIIMVILNL